MVSHVSYNGLVQRYLAGQIQRTDENLEFAQECIANRSSQVEVLKNHFWRENYPGFFRIISLCSNRHLPPG